MMLTSSLATVAWMLTVHRAVANTSTRLLNDVQGFVSSSSSIRFQQCLSLRTQPNADQQDIMFSDSMLPYTKNGDVVSTASYVLYSVCEDSSASCSGKNGELYIMPLASYMPALLNYKPERDEQYCETCRDAQDWCGQQAPDDRKLSVQQQDVDCNTCQEMSCFDEEENNFDDGNAVQYDRDELLNWMQEISVCVATDLSWKVDGDDVVAEWYAGFMCNGAGTGVEVGLFLDNACTIYSTASGETYASLVAGAADYEMATQSAGLLTFSFVNTLSCQNVQYNLPAEAAANDQEEGNNNNENDDNENDVADACDQLNQQANVIADLNTCTVLNGGDNNGNQQNEEAEADNDSSYDWYAFQIAQDDADNTQSVCKLVQSQKNGDYSQFHVFVDVDKNGNKRTMYDYSANKNIGNYYANGLGRAKVLGLILLIVLLVVGVALQFGVKCLDKRQGKRQPLVSSAEGDLA